MIYIFWSFYDGIFQAYAYWLMGSLSNNSRKLSHYSGLYKSLQSAGAAVVWRLDGLKISYYTMYLSTWLILVISLLTTIYVAFFKVLDHSEDEPVILNAPKDILEDVDADARRPASVDVDNKRGEAIDGSEIVSKKV